MRYYIDEPDISSYNEIRKNNAAGKARNDISTILDSEGFVRITIPVDGARRFSSRGLSKLMDQFQPFGPWREALDTLASGDFLLVQFPPRNHSALLAPILGRLQKRGVRVCLLIHDLELLRVYGLAGWLGRRRIEAEELMLLKLADSIIAHNEKMATALSVRFGIPREKIVSLGIFDYLAPRSSIKREEATQSASRSFVVAGNLSREKAGYLYKLPETVAFRLYGAGYDVSAAGNIIKYCGSFDPDDGPDIIKGDFGLVWDGPSADTCIGPFGEYMRYNNPHKVSLYLATGLPVVIWEKAALAEFITDNGAGVVISSLNDLREITYISANLYYSMVKSVRKISDKVLKGYYTKAAIKCCI